MANSCPRCRSSAVFPRTLEAAAETFGVTYYTCHACQLIWLIYDDDPDATPIPVTFLSRGHDKSLA